MKIRTQLKAGSIRLCGNHSEAFKVRTTLKAGTHGQDLNHNELLNARMALKAGGIEANDNEGLKADIAQGRGHNL